MIKRPCASLISGTIAAIAAIVLGPGGFRGPQDHHDPVDMRQRTVR